MTIHHLVSFAFQTVSYSKVFKLLNNIDKISARILKVTAPVITNWIAKIFNGSVESGEFPLDWKIARVTPLHKKGPRNLLDNYRPISILSTISKVLEKILYEQFYDYLSTNNLFSKHQFGFRHFHSTMSTLLDCTNEWHINMDHGLYNLVVFLDLKKAFDTVDHALILAKLKLYALILAKLKLYGVADGALNLVESYFSDRLQVTSVNGKFSTS